MRAPRGDVPARGQPLMLATAEARPFSRAGWLFEIKYDGVRVLASRRGGERGAPRPLAART